MLLAVKGVNCVLGTVPKGALNSARVRGRIHREELTFEPDLKNEGKKGCWGWGNGRTPFWQYAMLRMGGLLHNNISSSLKINLLKCLKLI